jgi:hypothetical protein
VAIIAHAGIVHARGMLSTLRAIVVHSVSFDENMIDDRVERGEDRHSHEANHFLSCRADDVCSILEVEICRVKVDVCDEVHKTCVLKEAEFHGQFLDVSRVQLQVQRSEQVVASEVDRERFVADIRISS